MNSLFATPVSAEEDQWIAVSDMMAGLMMIFLFIAIIYIYNINRPFEEIDDIANILCDNLKEEFAPDEERWNMAICEGGRVLIGFKNDANFELNSDELTKEFKEILASFYPRLMMVVMEHEGAVSELRIEGHTDSTYTYSPGDTPVSGYIYNTRLSQGRSRNVMAFSLNLPEIKGNDKYIEWSFSHVTAHGMSYSNRIFAHGREDHEASRRVEFRLRTRAEEELIDMAPSFAANEA